MSESIKMKQKELFSNKAIYQLIIPLIIEQILAVTVGMADVMMISVAGETAVSGVSLVDMINVLIINIFAALATGGAVVSAQFIGKKDRKQACSSAYQLLLITIIISVFVMMVMLLFKRSLLKLLFGEIEPDVMKNAIIYLNITAVSYPFLAIYNSCAALFRSMGNSRVSMALSFLMNVINIGGNAFFIFYMHLGIAGVAIPSLIARFLASIIILYLICNSKNQIYIEPKLKIKLDSTMIKKILHIGIPNGLENGLFQLGRVLVVGIIASFGTVQIAANAVANNIDSMGCIPGQAISLAMITVVGQCVGAGDYKQSEQYTKKLMKISYAFTSSINALIILVLPLLLAIYHLSDDTLKLAQILIWIHCGCAIFLWPASFTLPNALRAANDVKFTMITSIASMWIFRIMTSYILGKFMGMGAIGVWIGMILDWIFRVICFIWRYCSGKWKLHEI
ncbi:MATE family efflux transporter [Lachnospiraceae bacterium 46-61]